MIYFKTFGIAITWKFSENIRINTWILIDIEIVVVSPEVWILTMAIEIAVAHEY